MLEIVAEPLVAGTILAGKYRLERVLGEGGMGVVWAARDEAAEADVAIKVLADDRATDPTQQKRILREAAAATTIDHPNVVKISAVLETDAGVPFIVMERLEGESLRARLIRDATLDEATCIRVLGDVSDAVLAAHAAGIVHRDLKPENIFLTRTGAVKVLDFGIAKQMKKGELASASLTETGAVLGTPYYMAPEQVFADSDVDARADVWSLGVILYECLAGKRPTEAEGFGPILKRITAADFDPLPPSIHPRLAALAMRMLSRDRAARPSLADVRLTIHHLDEPSPASLARTAETTAPRRRAAYAIAAVVLAAGGIAYAAQSRIHASESAPVAAGGPREASTNEIARLLKSASANQQKGDGKACLADLDALDRTPNLPFPLTTDLESDQGGVRASCLMMSGECEAGKKHYREWLPHHISGMDAALVPSAAEQMAGIYHCPNSDAGRTY